MATVQGVFEVLDRASPKIRQIRNEAVQADVAVNKLGHSLDKLGTQKQLAAFSSTSERIRQIARDSEEGGENADHLVRGLERIGAPQLSRNVETTNRAISNTSSSARGAERDVRGASNEMDVLGKRTERAGGSLDRFTQKLTALRPPMMALLVPLVGLASQGLGGLAAGFTSLIPKMTDLIGLAGPMGIAFVGVGGAMLSVKLALGDMQKALHGNKKAIEELTPQGKQFLETLKLYKPVLKEVRSAAQEGLFPGLNVAIRQLAQAQPVISQIMRGFGSQVGGIAQNFSGMFTNPAFMTDFQRIAEGGQRAVGQMGEAFLHLANAARYFLTAALPFADWLGHTVVRLSEWAEHSARAGRETGRLGDFFSRTRQSLETFGSILHNVWDILKAVGHASRAMGEGLWESIDRTTKKWSDFLNGAQGQQDMQSYFVKMKPVLHEVGKFFGDLVKGIGELSAGSGATKAFRALDEAIPSLVKGLGALTETFGTTLISGLSEAIKLLSTLASSTGPLGGLFKLAVGVLQTVNSLLSAFPALGTVISTALTVAALGSFASRILGMTGPVGKLAGSWLGVKSAADAAAGAQARAAGVGSVAAARGGVSIGGVPVTGTSASVTNAERSGLGLGVTGATGLAALKQRAGGAIRGLPGAALGGLAAGAEFLAPLMVLQGVLGGLGSQGSAWDRTAMGANQALFGLPAALFPSAFAAHTPQISGGEAQERAQAAFMRSAVTGRTATVDIGHGTTYAYPGGQKAPGYNAATGAFSATGLGPGALSSQIYKGRAESRSLEQSITHPGRASEAELGQERGQLAARLEMLHTYEAALSGLNKKSREGGDELAQSFGTAFKERSRKEGPSKALQAIGVEMLGQIHHIGREGKVGLATGLVGWASQIEQEQPKLRKPMEEFVRQMIGHMNAAGAKIRYINGEILEVTAAKWKEIGSAMNEPMLRAEWVVKGAMSRIAQAAIAELSGLGYSGAAAKSLVSGVAHGTIKFSDIGKGELSAGSITSREHQAENFGAKPRHAAGGRLGGLGLQDSVPLALGMAAPGELVVNRHQERLVNGLLSRFGTSLGQVVSSHPWPHNAGFAGGGLVGVGGVPHGSSGSFAPGLAGVHAGVASVVTDLLKHYPLSVTSTLSGTHASQSLHYLGEAVDVAGSPAMMNQAAAWLGRTWGRSLEEGIHNPNLSIKHGAKVPSSFWGEPTWAEHANHIHVGVLGGSATAGGVGGGAAGLGHAMAAQIHLKRMAAGGGWPGAIGSGYYNAIAAGMEQKINSGLSAVGAGASGHRTGGQAAGNTQMRAWARAGLRAAGLPGTESEVSTMVYTMGRESGGNPRSENTTDSNARAGHPSRGLMELIPENFSQYHVPGTSMDVFDPVANVAASARYMIGRYGHIVGMSPYASGGRLPGWGGWNRTGGSGRFHGPTVLGVGEGHGIEDVQITPHEQRAGGGKGGAGGRVQVNFAPGSIIVQGADEAGAQEFVDKVMHKLADAIDNMGLEHETEVSK